MKKITLAVLCIVFISNVLFAQNQITKEDYNRAVSFLYSNYNNEIVFNTYIHPDWFPDSTGVWYIDHTPDSKV